MTAPPAPPRIPGAWAGMGRAARAFRIAHLTWGAVALAALTHLWRCALTGRRDRPLVLGAALLGLQGAALIAGRGDCPMGPFQRRLGDPVPMFELVLPPSAARAAIPVLGGISLAGFALLALRRPHPGRVARTGMRDGVARTRRRIGTTRDGGAWDVC